MENTISGTTIHFKVTSGYQGDGPLTSGQVCTKTMESWDPCGMDYLVIESNIAKAKDSVHFRSY